MAEDRKEKLLRQLQEQEERQKKLKARLKELEQREAKKKEAGRGKAVEDAGKLYRQFADKPVWAGLFSGTGKGTGRRIFNTDFPDRWTECIGNGETS